MIDLIFALMTVSAFVLAWIRMNALPQAHGKVAGLAAVHGTLHPDTIDAALAAAYLRLGYQALWVCAVILVFWLGWKIG